jgi:membrane-associated protease RseP (regulator of RpoE activity)
VSPIFFSLLASHNGNAPRMIVTKKGDSTEPEIVFAVAELVASSFVAKVFKESKDQKCGISLRQALPPDPVTISRLDADGLFANTDLRIGMEVVSVNGVLIDGMTRIKAIQQVKDAEGDLTVVGKAVAGGAVAVVFKESKDEKCGITLRQTVPSGPVTVSGIGEDGLFAKTDLKAGMQVISINNVAVEGMTKEQAIQIVKDTEGKLTVVGQPYVAKKSSMSASNPPPGIADGGIWGINKYMGTQTEMLMCAGCLCCGLPGLCVCFCPQDDRDAYRLGNKVRMILVGIHRLVESKIC